MPEYLIKIKYSFYTKKCWACETLGFAIKDAKILAKDNPLGTVYIETPKGKTVVITDNKARIDNRPGRDKNQTKGEKI